MPHFVSRSSAVALTSAALMGVSALALPAVAGADEPTCAPEDVTYSVSGGTVEWGVKQSFRNYIKGPIASGDWTLSEGVTFDGTERGADGRFIWPIADGSGEVRADDSATASAAGSVTLTGHHDVMNTTLSNPSVDIDGDSGSLKFDYRAKSPESFTPDTDYTWVEGTQATAVEFTLEDVPSFHTDGTVTVTTGPTAMSESFLPAVADFYDTGVEMDAVTLNLVVSGGCEAAPGGDDNGGDTGGDNGDGDDDGTIPGDDDNSKGGGGIFGSLGSLLNFLPF